MGFFVLRPNDIKTKNVLPQITQIDTNRFMLIWMKSKLFMEFL